MAKLGFEVEAHVVLVEGSQEVLDDGIDLFGSVLQRHLFQLFDFCFGVFFL